MFGLFHIIWPEGEKLLFFRSAPFPICTDFDLLRFRSARISICNLEHFPVCTDFDLHSFRSAIFGSAKQGSVNQPFIVNKKRGILRGRECPSQLYHNFIITFNTSSRHTLPHFTKYLWWYDQLCTRVYLSISAISFDFVCQPPTLWRKEFAGISKAQYFILAY